MPRSRERRPRREHNRIQLLQTVLDGVDGREEPERHRERTLALGATHLLDRADDPEEPLYVLADPAGHPFCVFVSPRP